MMAYMQLIPGTFGIHNKNSLVLNNGYCYKKNHPLILLRISGPFTRIYLLFFIASK